MIRSLAGRLPFRLALIFGGTAGLAAAQESVTFSTSSSTTAGFGTLDSSEIALYDAGAGVTRPWLMKATSAFFSGDVTGDGLTDEWKNVDALYVAQDGERVSDVLVSFNVGFGAFSDGDVVRLGSDGALAAVWSEATLVSAFGISDGGMDLDGLHVAADGRIYVSFADDEASTVLSTDAAGVITDGSIVWWDPVGVAAGVELTEGSVDALVSNALAKSTKIGDTLGVAMDANGVIAFSVQSPTSDDASVFSSANGGEYISKEADLGLTGSPEIDALDLTPAPAPFLAARAAPRIVPANAVTTVDLDGMQAAHLFVLTLGLTRGDSSRFPFDGFGGLSIDPGDPLFLISISGLPWAIGATDIAGHASVVFPPAPAGFVFSLFGQAYDFDAHACGAPIALEFTG